MTLHPPDTSFMSVSWLAMIWISMGFNLKLKSVLIWHSGLWGVTLVMITVSPYPGTGARIGVNNCHSISLITIIKTWELWLDADGLIWIFYYNTRDTRKLFLVLGVTFLVLGTFLSHGTFLSIILFQSYRLVLLAIYIKAGISLLKYLGYWKFPLLQ